MASEKTYEMLWDCPYCSAKKLLGKSHRHCPNCGAPQDPSTRYFPPESEKVAVEDHVYVGVDLVCRGCQTPNSRAAKHCGNCGGPLEEGKDVAVRSDVVAPIGAQVGAASPQMPPAAGPQVAAKKGRGLLYALLAVGALVVMGLVLATVAALWTKQAGFVVAGHTWTREIPIEEYRAVRESAWCDKMPSEAMAVNRHREKRGTEKVQAGEDCSMRKVDNGDGTYKEKRECQPRYKEEPVYADKCDFTLNQWRPERKVSASGASVADTPKWPEIVPPLRAGTCVGCEREGKRVEVFSVRLKDRTTQKESGCDLPFEKWGAFKPGTAWTGNVSVLTGGLDCDSLKASN